MKHPMCLTMLALTLAMLATTSYAAGDGPAATVSGYGTFAYTMSDTDTAEFGRSNQLYGVKKSPVNWVDSNLGVQGTLAANDWLSFTAQGLARKLNTGDWGAELYWAYARAKIGHRWTAMAGRIAAPIYLMSDYRNVGFANTMIRPPQEMYAQVPYDNLDGAALSHQADVGGVNLTTQLVAGSTRQDLTVPGAAPGTHTVLKIHGAKSVNVVAEQGALTLRFSYTQSRLTADNSATIPLTVALNTAGTAYGMPQLNALSDRLAANNKKASFTSAGLVLDRGKLLLQAEAGKRKVDAFIPDTRAWYLLGGHRMGAFMPYVAYASLRSHNSVANIVPAACGADLPASCAVTVRTLAGSVDAVLARGLAAQSTISTGVRWNFAQSASFKAQLDRVRPHSGSGLLINAAPGYHGSTTVCAAGVDFLF